MIEDLGSDSFLHLQCNHVDLVVRTGREVALERGSTVGLTITPGQMHIFQGETRIEP